MAALLSISFLAGYPFGAPGSHISHPPTPAGRRSPCSSTARAPRCAAWKARSARGAASGRESARQPGLGGVETMRHLAKCEGHGSTGLAFGLG